MPPTSNERSSRALRLRRSSALVLFIVGALLAPPFGAAGTGTPTANAGGENPSA